jgi:transcription initiation factor TFIID subunit 6
MPNGIYLPSPPNSQTTGPSRPSQQRLNEPSQPQPRASAHLSKELQLYYKRLTEVLPPSSASATLKEKEREKEEKKRTAALSSLRGDSGLQGLVPYLVRWVGEGVRGTLLKESGREGDEEDGEGERDEEEDGERRRRNTDEEGDEDVDRERLEMFLDVIDAMLDNKTMFIEPFVSAFFLAHDTFL